MNEFFLYTMRRPTFASGFVQLGIVLVTVAGMWHNILILGPRDYCLWFGYMQKDLQACYAACSCIAFHRRYSKSRIQYSVFLGVFYPALPARYFAGIVGSRGSTKKQRSVISSSVRGPRDGV